MLARSHVDLIFSLKVEVPHTVWPRHDPRNGGLEHISNKNGSDCLPFVQVGVWQMQQAHLETAVWRTRLPAPPVWVWTGWGLGSAHLAEPEKAMTRSGRAEKAQLAAAVEEYFTVINISTTAIPSNSLNYESEFLLPSKEEQMVIWHMENQTCCTET